MARWEGDSGLNLGMVQDIKNLDRLRQLSHSKEGQDAALQSAARQFESIFTQTLFKGMRQANAVLTQDNPLNSSYTQFYEGMLDEQRVADMASKGGLGIAEMVVKQFSPATFTHQDGRVLTLPQRTERVYRTYQPPAAASHDLITAAKVGKEFAEKELPATQVAEQSGTARRRRVPAMGTTRAATRELAQPVSTDDTVPRHFTSPGEFVSQLMPLAKKAAAKLGVSPAVLVAQAALESGWGKRVITNGDGQLSHNLFGIKADRRWQGPNAVVNTLEYEQGVASRQQAAFRAYGSFEESFNDYVDFLTSGTRYQGALAQADNPDRYFEALQQAGYATDPDYARKLKQVLRSEAIAQYQEMEL